MSIATRFVSSTARPRLDLSGCVLYAPLWRPDLGGSTFTTIGDGGIPTHLCTVTGATWGTQGRTYTAGNLINAGNASSLNFTVAGTWGIWAKFNTGYGEITPRLFDHDGTTRARLYVEAATGVATFSVGTSAGAAPVDSASALTTNVWHFLLGTYDSTNARLYIDELPVVMSGDVVGTITASTTNLIIGNVSGGIRTVNGILGDFLILDRAISAQEYSQIRNATKWRYQ